MGLVDPWDDTNRERPDRLPSLLGSEPERQNREISRLVYRPRPEASLKREVEALANVFRLVLECYAKKGSRCCGEDGTPKADTSVNRSKSIRE